MGKERGPTQEECREWYAAIRDIPRTVQPSYKQAKQRVEWLSYARDAWLADEPIVSTIHERCANCGKVLVHRHNYIVPYRAAATTRYDFKYWYYGTDIRCGTICLSCFNKRRVEYKALLEWDETRLKINNAKYHIDKIRKEQYNECNQDNRRPA
jgi:hypothetical protein